MFVRILLVQNPFMNFWTTRDFLHLYIASRLFDSMFTNKYVNDFDKKGETFVKKPRVKLKSLNIDLNLKDLIVALCHKVDQKCKIWIPKFSKIIMIIT